jgi:MFS family permease
MTILDGTIVTVALPSIRSDLGFSQSSLAWVVNAYLIAFGGLLLLAGRLGDLGGRKWVFMTGLAVFTAASLWCGLAGSQAMLIVARFVQGIGGALTTAVVLGMITTMFPEPPLRARAIGVYAFAGAAGASVGVLAGSVIGLRAGADALGAVLVTAGLMLGVDTVVESGRYGWVSGRTLTTGAVTLALLAAFVVRQATAARPLLPLRIFRSRNVSGGNLVQALMVAGMLGFQFILPLYLRRVLGYGPAATGLAFLPITVAIAAISLGPAPRAITRFGPRAMLLTSLPLLVAGLGLLTRTRPDSSVTQLLPVLVLLGIGAGLALPAVMALVMSDVTAADSGVVSGLANTTQQVGGALGVAVAAALATWRSNELLSAAAGPHSIAAALTAGYHLAFAAGAGLVAVAVIVAAVVLRPRPAAPRPTPRTSADRPRDCAPDPETCVPAR